MSARSEPGAPPIDRTALRSKLASLADRGLAWRDRLLASPAFQRAAARNPLTRWIARRRARAVFDLVAGFAYSQVLLACVRLRLFDLLLERPRTADEIAASLELGRDATQRLLRAATAIRLIEPRSHGRLGIGPLGAPLARHSPIVAMVEHHDAFYADLSDPVKLLRGRAGATALGDYWPYAGIDRPDVLGDAAVARYSATMAASHGLVAEQILQVYPFRKHRRLLDVGGGEGGFLVAAASAAPGLELMLFDLPAVVMRARERLGHAGLLARTRLVAGDFNHDPLPTGADVATLIRVIHDHDDAQAAALLRKVARALGPGGRLVLAEPMAETPGAERVGDAYFGLYLLAMGSGRPRTARELEAMLRTAGFCRIRLLRNAMPLQTSVLIADVAPVSDRPKVNT